MKASLGSWALFCQATQPGNSKIASVTPYSCMITVRDFKFMKISLAMSAEPERGVSVLGRLFLVPLPQVFQHLHSKDDLALTQM